MDKKVLILIVVLFILGFVGFFIYWVYFGVSDDCGFVNLIRQNSIMHNLYKIKCEVHPVCEWRFLGGGMMLGIKKGGYSTCCPKELNWMSMENESLMNKYSDSVKNRCLVIID